MHDENYLFIAPKAYIRYLSYMISVEDSYFRKTRLSFIVTITSYNEIRYKM